MDIEAPMGWISGLPRLFAAMLTPAALLAASLAVGAAAAPAVRPTAPASGKAAPTTEFLLVPYIGACIHVPPPPPNQMVYVTSAGGIDADAIHEAYWVTGKMRIENRTTALGTAAYAVTATKVERYEY